jgi:pyruvate kinase
MKKPKIIATLGTTTDDRQVLENMVEAGLDCARINTAYATIEEYRARIGLLKFIADVDIMVDIKGPQLRLEAVRAYPISAGDRIAVGFADEDLHFNHNFYNDISVGDIVLFENGTIQTEVKRKLNHTVALEVIDPGQGTLAMKMGADVPGKYLNVPQLTEKDIEIIKFSIQQRLDYIALSFVRDFDDVKNCYDKIREFQENYGWTYAEYPLGIVAKIEEKLGIEALPDIIEKSKAEGINLSVMIARGDLFTELPNEHLPLVQEYLTKLCNKTGTFVITATGVLESMQHSPVPSRAEVNDVYNAVKQGTNALMLSGETSNGYYPAHVVRTLNTLIDTYHIGEENE